MRALSRACAVLAAAVIAGQALAVTVEDVTFYAPFDGDLTPAIALGDPTPQVEGEPGFTEGRRGQGVLVGGPGSQLQYPSAGNVNLAEGTVMCWVKPVDWEARDGRNHWFWDLWAKQGPGRFILYKYGAWQTYFYVRDDAGDIQVARATFMWQPGEWAHVCGTWRQGENDIYINGERVSDAQCTPMREMADIFRVGAPSGADHQDTVLDDLIIFNRALNPAEVAAVYSGGAPAESQELAVGRMTVPPVIDGEWTPQEWREAAGVVGLQDTVTGQAMRHPTMFLIGYDDANLYLAAHWKVPEEVAASPIRFSQGPVVANMAERDGDIASDDSVRWVLQSIENGTRYDLACNPRGVRWDARQGDMAWNPDWQCVSKFDESQWMVEAAVPWAELGGAPAVGQQWRLDFGRAWRRLLHVDTRWARMDQGLPGGLATFVGDGVRLQLSGLQELGSGLVDLAAWVSSGRDATVQVTARTDTGEYQLQETLAIPAGDGRTAQQRERLDDDTVNVLELTATEGAATVASLRIPFTFQAAVKAELLAYPTQQMIAVELDVPGASKPGADLSAQVRLSRGGTELATETVRQFEADRATVELSLAGQPEGDYGVQVTVLRGETPVGEQSLSYRKEPLPEWLGNDIGVPTQVPPPWTPVEVEGSRVRCWGR
ncbi:MAG TPA: LamG-like jellyroll fold domain-containing protein, partial [Armatimonadota bacterium]|nr:LamG-like jellyroll fold domain-containing protein [Armatimonadota bacterium]